MDDRPCVGGSKFDESVFKHTWLFKDMGSFKDKIFLQKIFFESYTDLGLSGRNLPQ